eukprot:SM000029S10594  [mRNA]  locus=s29:863457:864132:+ [translate_table: standard]
MAFHCGPQVQNLLQQMQARFQTMSDSIITRNILLTAFGRAATHHSRRLGPRALDEMGTRIDELERSIGDLVREAGAEGGSQVLAQPPPPPALKRESSQEA